MESKKIVFVVGFYVLTAMSQCHSSPKGNIVELEVYNPSVSDFMAHVYLDHTVVKEYYQFCTITKEFDLTSFQERVEKLVLTDEKWGNYSISILCEIKWNSGAASTLIYDGHSILIDKKNYQEDSVLIEHLLKMCPMSKFKKRELKPEDIVLEPH